MFIAGRIHQALQSQVAYISVVNIGDVTFLYGVWETQAFIITNPPALSVVTPHVSAPMNTAIILCQVKTRNCTNFFLG